MMVRKMDLGCIKGIRMLAMVSCLSTMVSLLIHHSDSQEDGPRLQSEWNEFKQGYAGVLP